jgi:hypothetical protein
VDRDLQDARRDLADLRRARSAVLELDALAQGAQVRFGHLPARHLRAVGLGDLEARVGEPVGQVAVVREQDQAGGVGVQPADGVQPPPGARTMSTTTGRPWVSLTVDTTPGGLWTAQTWRDAPGAGEVSGGPSTRMASSP